MRRPFKDNRLIGPISSIGGASKQDREFYQERFTQRMVSASKSGVQDPIEEIEYFEDTISDVPWEKFNEKERASISAPAISSIKTVLQISAANGQIQDQKVADLVSSFSMILFDKIADPGSKSLASSGLKLTKMNIRDEL